MRTPFKRKPEPHTGEEHLDEAARYKHRQDLLESLSSELEAKGNEELAAEAANSAAKAGSQKTRALSSALDAIMKRGKID